MRISDWSSDVCSSDLLQSFRAGWRQERLLHLARGRRRMLPEAVEIIVCEPAEVSKTAVQSNFRHCQLPTRIRAEHRAGLRQPVILQLIHRRGIAELLEAGMEPAAADPRHGDQVGKANRPVKVVMDT